MTTATNGSATATERRSGEPVLEAVGLAVGYGGLPVVRDLDIALAAGESIALLGANGAGKTTTLLALAGVLSPLAGETRWKGEATIAPLHKRARGGLSLLPETHAIFHRLTVRQNLAIGRGDVGRALGYFPELEAHLDRSAGLLSGGQQRMLGVGRALSCGPDALLIDELSLGLAPLVVDRLLDAIVSAAAEGVGILLVEQDVERALRVVDRAYIMHRGRMVFSGSAAELRGRGTLVRDLYFHGASSEGDEGAAGRGGR